MASKLSATRAMSNTSMAALVFSAKPLSGESAQRKIWTGNVVALSQGVLGGTKIKATIPIISSGADSPMALAIPIMVPVMIPYRASF